MLFLSYMTSYTLSPHFFNLESESIYFIRCLSEVISMLGTVKTFWPTWVLTGWQLMLNTGPQLDICLRRLSAKHQHLSLSDGQMPHF